MNQEEYLGFVHLHIPAMLPGLPTLLLLHGTGGNETDLIELGQSLLPGAGLISPRGKISENGMPRFFRRLAEGVFDQEDLRARANELADFIAEATKAYELDPNNIIAVGYSNGANIAHTAMTLRPECLAGGVLFRAMVTLDEQPQVDLTGKDILICAGNRDSIIPLENAERLTKNLELAGANVSLNVASAGHELIREDFDTASEWLKKVPE